MNAAPVVVYPPDDDGGRRVRFDGQILGRAFTLYDAGRTPPQNPMVHGDVSPSRDPPREIIRRQILGRKTEDIGDLRQVRRAFEALTVPV